MGLVRVESEGRVAHVILDRAERRNALCEALIDELQARLDRLADDPAVECVILRGAGPGFSAGIDALTLVKLATEENLRRIRGKFVAAFDTLERIAKPTIASVHGWAIGAGFELALACDLRVMAGDVTVGLPETRMGVVPDVGGAGRLASLIGAGRTKELILTSAMIDGHRAGQLGIANRVAAAGELAAATDALAAEVLRCSPTANGLAKRIVDAAAKPAFDASLAAELDAQLLCIDTPEFREAYERFAAAPSSNTPEARR